MIIKALQMGTAFVYEIFLLNFENPRNFFYYCFTMYNLFTIEIEDGREAP